MFYPNKVTRQEKGEGVTSACATDPEFSPRTIGFGYISPPSSKDGGASENPGGALIGESVSIL